MYGNGVDTLIKATGIETRYIVNQGTTGLDLNLCAAKQLLEELNTDLNYIAGIICVTFTPEYPMPADACIAQSKLGLNRDCLAFDINMACSGFGYGLYIASSIVKATGKKVLLLNGDAQTVFVSKEDKATYPVLSDVGTATLLSPTDSIANWEFSFFTDGARYDKLFIEAGGTRHPATVEDLKYEEFSDGSKRRKVDLYMDGYEVFRFVAMDASMYISKFINITANTPDLFDVFVPHQANMYMIEQLAKKLKIPKERMWRSGDKYGNPASASIPLTIAHNASEYFTSNIKKDTARVLISGFGGGLSISVGGISLNRDGLYKVIQLQELLDN
jgi:3-oxoacyl-[acyl-carrier-protein] synthase-3